MRNQDESKDYDIEGAEIRAFVQGMEHRLSPMHPSSEEKMKKAKTNADEKRKNNNPTAAKEKELKQWFDEMEEWRKNQNF